MQNKRFYFFVLFLTSFMGRTALAQTEPVEPVQRNVDILKQEGRLLSVSLRRGEPLRVFIVGRESAQVDLANMKVIIRRLQPGPRKVLQIKKTNQGYLVTEPLDQNANIEVKAETKGHIETFRFNLK